MATTEPIIIPIEGNPADFIADAKKVQEQMDILKYRLEKAGVSQAAYNKAVANNKVAMEQSTKAVKQNSMSITDFRSAYQTAMDVVRAGQQVYAQTVNVAQQYDQSVRDMMLSTGGTADETSRLIQVVDDAGVSFATLKTALKIASREGIEPNIDSLAKLSDEYKKLQPGVERNQFLMQKFGRGGLEMARAMELGGDALRKMSAEMDGGLVLTQENIDASEEYRKNIDELDDSVKGLKTSIGNALIPVLNDSFESTKDYSTAMERAAELTGTTDRRTNQWIASLIMQSDKLNENSSALRSYTDWAESLKETTVEMDDAVISLNSSYGDLLKNAMSLTTADQDFAKSQEDIKDQQADLMTEKAGLYAWETEKINDVQGKIDDLSVKYDENATEHEKRTQRILLDMSIEKIAMSDGEAGFSEAEYNKALALAETAGAAEAAAIREAAAMDATSTAIAKGTVEIDKFKQMYDLLTSKEITLTVNQVTNMLRADTLAEQMDNRQDHASGGDFLIPMSYGNEGFQMGNGDTASGGERVSITPRGGNPNADVIAAIERNRVSEERLVQLFENAVLRVMK